MSEEKKELINEELNDEKKELTQEELEQVTGGNLEPYDECVPAGSICEPKK